MAVYHHKPNISATHKHPQTAWTQAGVHFVGVGPLLDQTGARRAAVHKFETGVASRDAMGWSLIQQDARGGIWKHLWTQCWEKNIKNYMEKRKNYEKAEIEMWSPHFWQILDELLAVRCQVTSQFSHTFNNTYNTNLSAWAWGRRYFQLQRWCFEASARGKGGERSPGKHVDDHWVKFAW